MKSVLIDTNLLVLLVVGSYDKNRIGRHKRTKEFDKSDYEILCEFLLNYDKVWTTIHCLAETSNLLKQTSKVESQQLLFHLSAFFSSPLVFESQYQYELLMKHPSFLRFGVADTGFLMKSKKVSCSITADLDLFSEVLRTQSTVVNFNHLRTM